MSELNRILSPVDENWKKVYLNTSTVYGNSTVNGNMVIGGNLTVGGTINATISQIKSPDNSTSVTCSNLNNDTTIINQNTGGKIQLNSSFGGTVEIKPSVPGSSITLQPDVVSLRSPNNTKYLQVIDDGVVIAGPSATSLQVCGTQVSSSGSIVGGSNGSAKSIFGLFAPNGTMQSGSWGFATMVKDAVGQWSFTFTFAFATVPAGFVTPIINAGALSCYFTSLTTTGGTVVVRDTTGTGFDPTAFCLNLFGI